MSTSRNATSATFQAVEETLPGPQWQALQHRLWPSYRNWFLSEGDASRPSYMESRRALRDYMPELLPTFERLCELGGGGDMLSRFLSLYCPPPYLSGCTQAVWTGDEPMLVRNYDYSAQRLEGVLLKSCWNGQIVIAMSDALWGVLDGINQSGLAVSLAFGGRLESGKGFGIPLILRYILEFCTTTREAIEVLQRVPTHMSYNITLVDPSQRFATVYVAPDKLPVVRQVPVATNHQGRIEWPRHAWATATLERESAAHYILADTEETTDGLIAGFLRPPIFNTAYQRGFGTLYTAVYRPLSRQASYIWPRYRWDFSIDYFESGSYLIEYEAG
ncbi:MAG: C45 family autoproteolytic acyltransferase/hydrolase [bacterium]